MKKLILITTAVFITITKTFACGVCGGGASNQYLGILPQSQNAFVGLQYHYRDFTGNHTANQQKTISREYYNTVQLWGRYNIGKLQFFGFVPYIINNRIEQNDIDHVVGFGDASLLINYSIIRQQSEKKINHVLLAGVGIKLPTGYYNNNTILNGESLPNMQSGTKATDILLNTNYSVNIGKYGINIDASFAATTSNKYDYKFGNRLQVGMQTYRYVRIKAWNIVPLAGYRVEYSSCDYENYHEDIMNKMTGGTFVYLTGGFQCYYKNYGYQLCCYKPIYQQYADNMIVNNYKIDTGIYVIIK